MPTNTVEKTIEEAQAALTVKRAFGEPFEAGGFTILPAARVGGAGGGGGARGASGGWGTGFRLMSQPLGVYVIDEHDAHWVPVSVPNPVVALITAPIAAVRTLLFGRQPWERTLARAFHTPRPVRRPRPRVRAHRTRTQAPAHRAGNAV